MLVSVCSLEFVLKAVHESVKYAWKYSEKQPLSHTFLLERDDQPQIFPEDREMDNCGFSCSKVLFLPSADAAGSD